VVRSALLVLFRRIVAIYFREIEVAGDVPRADAGGRLFAANHVNGLVDPILVLTQAPCAISPVAKSTLWKIPGLKWLLDAADAVPIVRRKDDPNKSGKDNEAVFERVASHLSGGGNILIFPEGTSHNEPHLLELRSGAGRMLARAKESGAERLTFQTVALEFDARDIFRSRSLVLFGPVRSVDAIARGDDPAKAITDVIRDDLSELLVEGATWEERVLVVRVAEMFANETKDSRLEEINRIGRRIEEARRVLDKSLVGNIESRVSAYFSALEHADADDALVVRFSRREDAARVDPARLARAAILVLVLPLALLGAVLYWLPYQLPRFVTTRLGDDPDVTSTYKLGVGLVVYPIWAAALIAIAFWKLPAAEAAAATAAFITSPFAALAWLDRTDRLASRVRILAPSEERRDALAALAEQRAVLMRDLESARARLEASQML
jgi:1-acyl-sn-glycerol-3-phosphate acyltransferase